MISETIYSLLNADATLRTYFGIASSPLQSRIYFKRAPESAAKPYVVFKRITSSNLDTLSGVSDMKRSMFRFEIVVDPKLSSAEVSETIGNALESALEGNGYLVQRNDDDDDPTKSLVIHILWNFLE